MLLIVSSSFDPSISTLFWAKTLIALFIILCVLFVDSVLKLNENT